MWRRFNILGVFLMSVELGGGKATSDLGDRTNVRDERIKGLF